MSHNEFARPIVVDPSGRHSDLEALARLLRYVMDEAGRLKLDLCEHHAQAALRSLSDNVPPSLHLS